MTRRSGQNVDKKALLQDSHRKGHFSTCPRLPPQKKKCCHRVSLEKIDNLINSQGDRISIELLFLFNVLVNRSITINGFCCFFLFVLFCESFVFPRILWCKPSSGTIWFSMPARPSVMTCATPPQTSWVACPVKTPTIFVAATIHFNRSLGHQNPIFQSVPFCTNLCKYLSNLFIHAISLVRFKYSTTFSLSETCASAIQTKPRCHQYRWHKRPRATYVVAPWHCASPPQWLLQSLKTVIVVVTVWRLVFCCLETCLFLGELFEWRNTTNKEFRLDFHRS